MGRNLTTLLFSYRSYTPLPFLAVMVVFAAPTFWSVLAGFCIAAAGECLRFWGVSIAGSETRTTGTVGGSRLVVSGPYAFVRNPLYVGNIALYAGIGIMANALAPWLLIVAVLFFCFQYSMIVRGEEEYLQGTFGEEFRIFCANVPRFFPRLTPWTSEVQKDQTADFRRGLRSERRTLQAFSLVALIIITLWVIRG